MICIRVTDIIQKMEVKGMLTYVLSFATIAAIIGFSYISLCINTDPTPADKKRLEMEKYLIL